jgi:hypothetical protein
VGYRRPLDFAGICSQCSGRMKRRGGAVLLVALYVAAVALFGCLPHEHGCQRIFHPGGTQDRQCASCLWQASAVIDTPFVPTFIAPAVPVLTEVLSHESVFVPRIVSLASASRAPPAPMA